MIKRLFSSNRSKGAIDGDNEPELIQEILPSVIVMTILLLLQ